MDWRLILGIGAVPALIGLALRTKMPESPRWLMRHGNYEGVQAALGSFGAEVSLEDVEYTARQLEEDDRRAQRRTKWTAGVRRALFVVCMFFIFQQITGINIPLYYGPHLLGPLFQGSNSLVDKTISGVEVTAMLTVVNVAATYFAFRWIDRIGRRKLAIGGYLGMALFALLAAAGLTYFTGTARIVVVMIGLAAFIASFAIGVGGTGWLLQGEVFPTEVRGRAASTGATVDWLANFALVEVFPVWQSGIGLGWVLVCFAALCVIAIGFVYRFVPETKGRSVEEITQIFEQEARTRRRRRPVSGPAAGAEPGARRAPVMIPPPSRMRDHDRALGLLDRPWRHLHRRGRAPAGRPPGRPQAALGGPGPVPGRGAGRHPRAARGAGGPAHPGRADRLGPARHHGGHQRTARAPG